MNGSSSAWSKAGLIVKASLTQGSAYAAMMVTGGHGVRMQWAVRGQSRVVGRWAGTDLNGPAPGDGYHQLPGGGFTVSGTGDIAPAVPAGGGGGSVTSALAGTFAGLIAVIVVGTVFITAEYRPGVHRSPGAGGADLAGTRSTLAPVHGVHLGLLAVRSMPDETSGDDALRASLREIGHADGIAAVRRLSGGVIADAWLITWADGTSAVGKIVNSAAPDLFRTEADGLAALRGTGHLATPDVLAVTDRLLLLEALVPRDDSAGSWEAFARDMAGAHRAVVSDRFGWPCDGYLGRLRQVNTWTANEHEFFAEHRLLRYLTEPPAEQALTADDRRALERLCARLPEIIPPMPAVLTHGDLWTGNLVSQPGGRITVIDPAVSYTWAEVDLSMLWGNARPPASDRFFAVYQELNPSPPGWAERMPVLHLRELLSSIAHFGPAASYDLGRVRDTLGPFYQR